MKREQQMCQSKEGRKGARERPFSNAKYRSRRILAHWLKSDERKPAEVVMNVSVRI